MNPGYLFWGTGDGFSSNLLGNRTESPIDLRMLDDKIRPVKVRNGNSLTEVYYLLFEQGPYLFASAVDPTAKDNQGRDGFLVCSLYFDKRNALKGGVVEVLNYLIKTYKEKKSANQILSHGECESKVAYLTLEGAPANRTSSSNHTLITKCTSALELNLALSNKMLGFAPSLAYLFLSDVEGVKTLPTGTTPVTWEEISVRNKQLTAAAESNVAKKREESESAHNQFRQILAMGESGKTDEAGAILLKMVPSHSIYSELLKFPEYAALNIWYNNAIAKNQQESEDRDRAFVDEVYNSASRKFKNGDLEGAKISLNQLSKASISKNPRLQKLISDISDREKSIGFKKKMVMASLIIGVVCLIGGGAYFYMNHQGADGAGQGPNAGGNQVQEKDSLEVLSAEWQKHESADIQLLLKATAITGYDTLSGKLKWSEGAKCFLLTEAKDKKTHHLPFELIDKIAKVANKEKILRIIGHDLNDIDNLLKIQKKLIFIGKNNKYMLLANEQNKTIEFAKLNESYEPIEPLTLLSVTSNENLFNSADLKYVYTVLGFSTVQPNTQGNSGNSGSGGSGGRSGNGGNGGGGNSTGSGGQNNSHGRIRP